MYATALIGFNIFFFSKSIPNIKFVQNINFHNHFLSCQKIFYLGKFRMLIEALKTVLYS